MAALTRFCWRPLQGAALCGLLAVASPVDAQQDLSPQEARVAAAMSVSQGRNGQALALTDALLARDPNDVDALVSRARVLRNMGDTTGAQKAARRAFQYASGDLEHYAAAMAMAQALSSDGHRTRAQLWLRRAAQHAPSQAAEATAARDYRYVALRNPWRVHLSFGITPTDNVNNGSRHDSLFLDLGDVTLEVPFTAGAMPLSGTEISAGVTLQRRLHADQRGTLQGHLSARTRTYRLSSEARAAAPDANGSDYAFSALTAGLTYRTGDQKTPLEWRGSVERTTYGGALYADILRASAHRGMSLPNGALRLGVSGERLNRHDIAEHATGLGFSADLVRPLADGARISFSVSAQANWSDASVLDHDARQARVAYNLADPVLGSDVTLDLGLGWTDYDTYPTSADGRRDRSTTLGATAVLEAVTLYGFNPTVRLEHRVTESNLRRQETEQTSLSFGFRSAF